MKYCRKCGRELAEGVAFCPGCGTAVARYCKKCGRALGGDEAFCPACGTPAASASRPGEEFTETPVAAPAAEPVVPAAAPAESPASAPDTFSAASPMQSAVPATMADYERAVDCSLVCVIVSAVLLVAAAAVWWFVNIYVGCFLCLAAEVVAVIPNTKVQNLFKKANRHITDKKQRVAEEKALRKELKKKNGTYRATGIFACVCLAVLIALVLAQYLLPGVIGGSGSRKILADVKEEYGINSNAESRISKMFDAFDQAFARLGKNPSDRDFYEYADAVAVAYSQCFDEIDEKYDVYLDADELDALCRDLDGERYRYKNGSGSGERCAEAALNVVEGFSNFFYGVHWFTEEQLDRLG